MINCLGNYCRKHSLDPLHLTEEQQEFLRSHLKKGSFQKMVPYEPPLPAHLRTIKP